ncbi:hypothetical protein [Hymenobacter sp. NBH84]|uniref:hypothetical protein n=1 Tax=Hymenobacter sp. NBH84 TaxID=2596915 RepID=UPI0016279AC7|nr:hypothetical protein [Hymenobacter sp. NBH84]
MAQLLRATRLPANQLYRWQANQNQLPNHRLLGKLLLPLPEAATYLLLLRGRPQLKRQQFSSKRVLAAGRQCGQR